MKNLYKYLVNNASLLILLLVLIASVCFGQGESKFYCREKDYGCLIFEYQTKMVPNLALECKGESFDCQINQFTKIIESNPGDAYAYFLRGRFYVYAKESDRAIQDLTKVAEIIPDFTDTYNLLGFAYSFKGEYNQAIKAYNNGISISPKNSLLIANRGLIYRKKGDFKLAFADYNKAIKLNPSDDNYYNLRAELYVSSQKDFAKALADYNKAIELSPDNWRNYYSRGNLYLMQGEQAKADADSKKANELRELEKNR